MAADGEGGADRDPGSLRHVASVPLLGELQLTGEGPPLPAAAAAGEAAGSGHPDPESGKAPSGPPSRRGFVPPERRSGWLQTAVVLLSELVGSGVLALPFALARLGWVPGLVLVLALALLNLYSGVLLWRLHLLHPTVGVTYGDLAGAVGGPPARAAVFAVAYCYFFALQIVYLLTAAECLQVALFWVERCLYWYTLAAFAVLLAMSQCRSLHAISYLGVLSSAAVLLSVVVLLVDSLSTWNARAAVDIEAFATGVSFQDAFAAGVSILFLYAGQGLYPEIMAEMQVPEMFGKSLYASSGVMVAFYLSAGVPMYFRYGSSVSGNLLYSMPKGWMRTVAGLAMAFHVAVSYVIATQIVGRALHVRLAPATANAGGSWRAASHWLAITSTTGALAFVLACSIPFFSQLLSIIASLCMSPLALGFPAGLWILAWRQREGLDVRLVEKVLCWGMVALCAVLMVVGATTSILALVDQWKTFGKPFSCILHQ